MPWDIDIADVLPNEIIESVWGNSVRDRVVHPVQSINSLPTNVAPGGVAYSIAEKGLFMWDGANWRSIATAGAAGGASAPLNGALFLGGNPIYMAGGVIGNLGNPVSGNQAMPRDYADARYLTVATAGTGPLVQQQVSSGLTVQGQIRAGAQRSASSPAFVIETGGIGFDASGSRLINLGDATGNQDAMNRRSGDARYLQLDAATGQTVRGGVTFQGITSVPDATGPNNALNRSYADTRYFPLSGSAAPTVSTGATFQGPVLVPDAAGPKQAVNQDSGDDRWTKFATIADALVDIQNGVTRTRSQWITFLEAAQ